MSPSGLVTLIALLSAAFLLIVAALLWQQAHSRSSARTPVYSVDDAVEFISERITAPASNRLNRSSG